MNVKIVKGPLFEKKQIEGYQFIQKMIVKIMEKEKEEKKEQKIS